ncbi:MAG: hypothetical protein J7527_02055 [Chitinophagaceae bacterium]|nr:hypothetical protein [Chitinophagaceae bacterium]
MAISRNPLKLTGRFDFITLYKVGDQIRMRVRTPLSRKRVLKSPEFRNTRIHAGWMARASKIGSQVYQALPKDFRQFWMYRAFVGEAMTMLKQGQLTDKEVFRSLWKTYAELWQDKSAVESAGKDAPVKAIKKPLLSPGRRAVRWHKKENLPISWDEQVFIAFRSFVPEMRAP